MLVAKESAVAVLIAVIAVTNVEDAIVEDYGLSTMVTLTERTKVISTATTTVSTEDQTTVTTTVKTVVI